ncbi:MAG TPA: class I SAM-dependent methyltransferase [Pyrinomonadaceae bacterium]|jgi:ubiquinone/menaquinone biosynthesis C-methylase UbiE
MPSSVNILVEKFYRSSYAARITLDGTPVLAEMVRKRLHQNARVLDVGAGAGNSDTHPCKRNGSTLVGIDCSEDIVSNPHLDDHYVQDAENMPFENESFDMVFSDFTFEHLAQPEKVVREIFRILKPNGTFIFRTVNAFHYVAVLSTITPDMFRPGIFKLLGRREEDSFPTLYRLNTKRKIERVLHRNNFEIEEIKCVEGRPDYLRFSPTLFRLGIFYERLANSSERWKSLRSNFLIAARKRSL